MENGKQTKVIYSNLGVANFFGDYIEINKRLKYNKPLRDYIVKHELGHTKKFDILHEFQIDWKIMPTLILFVLNNPSTWIDFFPIQIRKNKFIYDINLMILYFFTISLMVGLGFLIF